MLAHVLVGWFVIVAAVWFGVKALELLAPNVTGWIVIVIVVPFALGIGKLFDRLIPAKCRNSHCGSVRAYCRRRTHISAEYSCRECNEVTSRLSDFTLH